MLKNISVIIPAYNCERRVLHAVDSVKRQDYDGNIEIIVVDDGSKDGTLEAARSVPGVVALGQSNRGPSSARNYGISVSTGEIIAFLDADDEWFPEKLSKQVEIFEKFPEVGATWCNFYNEPEGLEHFAILRKISGFREGQALPQAVPGLMRYSFPATCSVAAVRRSVLEQVGSFDETLLQCEDYDLWIRLAAVSSVYFDGRAMARKWDHGDNLTSHRVETLRWHLEALERLPEKLGPLGISDIRASSCYELSLASFEIKLMDELSRGGDNLGAMQILRRSMTRGGLRSFRMMPAALRAAARELREWLRRTFINHDS